MLADSDLHVTKQVTNDFRERVKGLIATAKNSLIHHKYCSVIYCTVIVVLTDTTILCQRYIPNVYYLLVGGLGWFFYMKHKEAIFE